MFNCQYCLRGSLLHAWVASVQLGSMMEEEKYVTPCSFSGRYSTRKGTSVLQRQQCFVLEICPFSHSNRASHRYDQHVLSAGGALLAGPLLVIVCNGEEWRTMWKAGGQVLRTTVGCMSHLQSNGISNSKILHLCFPYPDAFFLFVENTEQRSWPQLEG